MQTLFYASGNEEGYEVVMPPGTSEMDINMLPPVKGESLPYAVAPQQACLFFLLLTGTAAVSVLISFGTVFRWEILVYAGTKNTGNSR